MTFLLFAVIAGYIVILLKFDYKYDKNAKALIVDLKREDAVDTDGRRREDAEFWGIKTHKKYFRINFENLLDSGSYYEQIPGSFPIKPISDESYQEFQNIKWRYFTAPLTIKIAILGALFFFIFLFPYLK